MKTILVRAAAGMALMTLAPPPYAQQMSDSLAIKTAKELWGEQAMIGSVRDTKAVHWTRQVGFKSYGCKRDFTILGVGSNTWESAFVAASTLPVPIHGPFKGQINLEIALAGKGHARLIVDGVSYPPIDTPGGATGSSAFRMSFPLDTTKLAAGIHVVCAAVFGPEGKVSASDAILLSADHPQ